jgi:hypothetical protein
VATPHRTSSLPFPRSSRVKEKLTGLWTAPVTENYRKPAVYRIYRSVNQFKFETTEFRIFRPVSVVISVE